MPPKYAQSPKFAALSANERARRISKIRDPRKRLKAEKYWGVEHGDSGGDGGILGGWGDVSRGVTRKIPGLGANVVTDVPQLTKAVVYDLPKMVGTAAYKDISTGKGITKPGGLLFGESEGRRLVTEQVKGVPGQLKLLADPHEWYENPLIQVVNVAGLVLPFARVGSVAALSRSLRVANPELNALQANKLAVAESFHPGFARAKGLKGGIAPRVTKARYGPEEGVLGRMPSRQPIIRGAQRVIDREAARLDITNPASRWSASSRAQRMAAKRDAAAERLEKAKRSPLEKKVVSGLLGPAASFWRPWTWGEGKESGLRQFADRPGKTDRARAAAMVAGLESPLDLGVREAAETKVKYLHDVLEENDQLRPMQDAVEALKKQREEALEVDPEVDTKILDQQIWHGQGKLDVLMGRDVPELDSPGRTRVYNTMVATIGRKAADDQIKQWDLAAWGNDLDNPTAFYDKVEVQRLADSAGFRPTGTALYQRMRESDPERWHFEVQEALGQLRGKTMQVGQLTSALTKAGVKQEELRNSGLQRVFNSLGKNTTVAVDDVLDDLREERYFSRYDPDVSIRNDGHTGPNTEYGPHDSPGGPALVSREGLNGEYHEMVITLPDLEREPFEAAYRGRGESHWGEHNVVYHVRFQTYMEGDKKVLLIEEIQSDWASDYRRAKKLGAHVREPEEARAELERQNARLQEKGEELAEADRAYDEWLVEKNQRVDDGIELDPAFEGRGMALLSDKLEASDDYMFAQSDLNNLKRNAQRGHLPSPMHQERYLDNALHNVMRYADANQVDEVVVIDGGTQALRNRAIQLEEIEDEAIHTEDGFQDYGEWVDSNTGAPLSNEQITRLLETQPSGALTREYNEQIPERLRKLYDAEPEYSDSAYVGRYSAQPDPYDYGSPYNAIVQTEDSSMPGTIIRMTPEVQGRMRESRALYQTDPAGEVKGATEFLADGRRRVTMFVGADATTWSHELIHVLTPDLSPEHRKVLETEIAGGKPYEEWGTAEHEKLADAWDTYWREGHAPPSLRDVFADLIKRMKAIWRQTGHEAVKVNPVTARTFDEMLGKRYQNSVVLKEHEVNQVRADIKDLQKALDSGDVDQLDEAVNALAELSHQAEVAGAKILTDGKTPEQAAAILEGLAVRKNAVAEDFRRRGLLDSDEDAKGYFPHFSMWESIGAPPADPVRMAAVGDVVGTPKIQAKTINRNRNKLIRMQTGEVLNDPAVITYVLRARLRLQATIRARRSLYEIGDPIVRGQGFDREMVYVRNPDVTPERMHKATQAANRLSREDFRSLSARQQADEIDEINDVDGLQEEMFWDPSKDKSRPTWVDTEDNVRTVPARIARNRLGDVFRAAPGGKLSSALGITNALFRMSSIYLRPWRYVPVNYTQNAIMLALTNPRAFTHLIKRDVARMTKDDPQLRAMIREQVGTIQATALPEFNIRPQNRMQRVERELTTTSGQMGEVLGRYADIPIREAAWLNHAGKYGFTDAADVRRLIEDPDLAEVRDIVSQRTKEDLIDFDTLTPYEKEVMTRYLALWPFIRGITKWPFMYAREYPARVVAGSLAGGAVTSEETNETVQDMGIMEMFGKNINVGKLDPSAPGREAVQNVVALLHGVSQVSKGKQPDLSALGGNYLAPGVREALGMSTGEGRKNWPKNVARTFIPGVGPLVIDTLKGGSMADHALRQMGMVRERTDGVRSEVKEWMAPVDKVTEQIRAKGQEPPEVLVRLQKLRGPYGDWKQYESEAKFAHRDRGESDKLTEAERVTGLLDVAKESYPPLYEKASASAKGAGWNSFEELVDSGEMTDEQLKAIDRYLYDQMFGAMEDIKRQAKKAGYDVE